MKLTQFLPLQWFSTPITQWSLSLLIFCSLVLLLLWSKGLLYGYLSTAQLRIPPKLQQFLASGIKSISPALLMLLCLDISTSFLVLPHAIHLICNKLPLLAILFQLGAWVKPLTQLSLEAYVETHQNEFDRLAFKTLMGPISMLIVGIVWLLLVLTGLASLNINITGLLTGLGIGGVAIALAVKNILEDLFSAFSIVLDKPFVVGDLIEVGSKEMGVVEHIGLKTTRISAVGGEQIIITNTDLLASRIRNHRHIQKRRVVLPLFVDYHTSVEQLQQLPQWIKEQVQKQSEQLTLDRVHFAGLGGIGYEFEIVYFVNTVEYDVFMDTKQQLLLAILTQLQQHNVQLAMQPSTLPAKAGS
jgi:small-conductance mechanosensitive channel